MVNIGIPERIAEKISEFSPPDYDLDDRDIEEAKSQILSGRSEHSYQEDDSVLDAAGNFVQGLDLERPFSSSGFSIRNYFPENFAPEFWDSVEPGEDVRSEFLEYTFDIGAISGYLSEQNHIDFNKSLSVLEAGVLEAFAKDELYSLESDYGLEMDETLDALSEGYREFKPKYSTFF